MHKLKKKTSADLVAHFQRRCHERLGMALNHEELKNMLRANGLERLRHQSNSKTLFVLRKESYTRTKLGMDVVLVYDKPRHSFVTVMPYSLWQASHDADGHRIDGGAYDDHFMVDMPVPA